MPVTSPLLDKVVCVQSRVPPNDLCSDGAFSKERFSNEEQVFPFLIGWLLAEFFQTLEKPFPPKKRGMGGEFILLVAYPGRRTFRLRQISSFRHCRRLAFDRFLAL